MAVALANIEAEQSVLGSLLLDRLAVYDARTMLSATDFRYEDHAEIYRAALAVVDGGAELDAVTLTDELQQRGKLASIGHDGATGSAYITWLIGHVPTSAHLRHYAQIVHDYSLRRQLLDVAGRIAKEAHNAESAQDALTTGLTLLGAVNQQLALEIHSSGDAIDDFLVDVQDWLDHPRDVWGLPTGVHDLDRLTGGIELTEFVILAGRPSMGKCLGRDTKVVLADGSHRVVQDVRVGDDLLGPDSLPRKVVSITAGRGPMYLVRQKRGVAYRVNGPHVLAFKRSKAEGIHRTGDTLQIAAQEAATKGPGFYSRYKGYKVAVELPARPVPIEPYFLGLWLGDGHARDARVTIGDTELCIQNYLKEYAGRRGEILHVGARHNNCRDYRITGGRSQHSRDNSIQAALRRMGLLDGKHIPDRYLLNCQRVRRELLAGLIDSDGHYLQGQNGPYEITQKSRALATQIKYLCDSLGYRTSLIPKVATIKKIGYEREVWRVRFNGDVNLIPVKMARKRAHPWTDFRDWRVTAVSVTPDGVGEYFGFELDGDGLFLLEDMTVTHNSALALQIARHVAEAGYGVAFFSLEMGLKQLMMRLVCSGARVNSYSLKRGLLEPGDKDRLWQEMARVQALPIWWCCRSGITIHETMNEVAKLQTRKDIALVVFDYLQLASSEGENQNIRVSRISQGLAHMAKSLNCCVLALSQLNRAIESRADPEPRMSDLRDSGSLEQDADKILFVHRDGATAQLVLAKNRNGKAGIGSRDFVFLEEYAMFVDKAQTV